ncbi:glycosyltransferase [Streptococcus hillyeri]|uniref:glycosyltransferase n=1 Tax=Streptococcus hillyeri TaxID=2282420 RepID=UPI0034E22A94
MGKKYALIVATVASMIEQFNMHNIRLLQEQGYTVHVAANFENGNTISNNRMEQLKRELVAKNVVFFHIDFSRNPFGFTKHIALFIELKKISKQYNYSIMHCHTPIGGVIARLVFAQTKATIVYTAHGFHFFKGGRALDWLLYYPMEYLCSYFTDILITINQEDYYLGERFLKARRVYKINGVGIEYEKIRKCDKDEKLLQIREVYNIPKDEIVLVSVGEVNINKNHITIVKALEASKLANVSYLIVGQGNQLSTVEGYIKSRGLDNKVRLLGYQKDIPQILNECDIFCFPSKREGLGLAALEAMAAGLPLLTSNSHGINDYSYHGKTGYKFNANDISGFAKGILLLLDKGKREKIGRYNIELAKKYDIVRVNKQMREIYSHL